MEKFEQKIKSCRVETKETSESLHFNLFQEEINLLNKKLNEIEEKDRKIRKFFTPPLPSSVKEKIKDVFPQEIRDFVGDIVNKEKRNIQKEIETREIFREIIPSILNLTDEQIKNLSDNATNLANIALRKYWELLYKKYVELERKEQEGKAIDEELQKEIEEISAEKERVFVKIAEILAKPYRDWSEFLKSGILVASNLAVVIRDSSERSIMAEKYLQNFQDLSPQKKQEVIGEILKATSKEKSSEGE